MIRFVGDFRGCRIYLASPFFSSDQIDRLLRVSKVLRQMGFKVWSAYEDGIVVSNKSKEEDMEKAFQENIKRIDECELVVGITDGKDMGTIFEMGYAYAKGKPIIGYAETLRDKPFNLMLARSCYGVAKNLEELRNVLIKFVTGEECEKVTNIE